MRSARIRRAWVAVSIVLLFVAVASAQAAPQNATGTEQQVRAAQQQLLQAAIQGNKEDVGKLVADDVTWVSAGGQVIEGKNQVLAGLPAPVSSVDVQQITPRGTSATVIGTVHMKDGTQRRMMQEWVNEDGQWKVVAHESTPIGGENAPAPGMTTPAGTSGTSASEARSVDPSLTSDDERAVWRAQTDIINAFGRGDTDRYSKLTANGFTRIQTNGHVYNRSEWLEYVGKNARRPVKASPYSDVHIQVDRANNIARVVLQLVPYSADGTPQAPERQTRIFALDNGQWQQVAAVSAPVSQR